MTLFLLDALESAPLVMPFQAGWIETDLPVEIVASLPTASLGEGDAALIAAGELPRLLETHAVVPEIAVVCDGAGSIAMRVPVRPDEIEASDIRLYETTATAELLARAALEPFYGIRPKAWVTGDAPDAQVVIVEGQEALRPPEAGFSEDLVRAWFILTGEPVVTHVLVVPKGGDVSAVVGLMEQSRTIGHERRRDVRTATAERFGLERERLTELAGKRRYGLTAADRRALLMLLQRGNKGSDYPYPWKITYDGEAESADHADG